MPKIKSEGYVNISGALWRSGNILASFSLSSEQNRKLKKSRRIDFTMDPAMPDATIFDGTRDLKGKLALVTLNEFDKARELKFAGQAHTVQSKAYIRVTEENYYLLFPPEIP